MKLKSLPSFVPLLALTLGLGPWTLDTQAQNNDRYGIQNRWNRLAAATGAVATNTTSTAFSYTGTNYDYSGDGTVVFPVYAGRGMTFFYNIQDAGSTNAIATWGIDLSYDGTNWTTTEPIQFTGTCSGTNIVIGSTNILPDLLNNARFGRLGFFKGGTAGNNVTNNWLAWSAFQ